MKWKSNISLLLLFTVLLPGFLTIYLKPVDATDLVKVSPPCKFKDSIESVNSWLHSTAHWDSSGAVDLSSQCANTEVLTSIAGTVSKWTSDDTDFCAANRIFDYDNGRYYGWYNYDTGTNYATYHPAIASIMDIKGDNGVSVRYLHHSSSGYTGLVSDNQVSNNELGQKFSTISNEGCTETSHIHFEVRKDGVLLRRDQWEFAGSASPARHMDMTFAPDGTPLAYTTNRKDQSNDALYRSVINGTSQTWIHKGGRTFHDIETTVFKNKWIAVLIGAGDPYQMYYKAVNLTTGAGDVWELEGDGSTNRDIDLAVFKDKVYMFYSDKSGQLKYKTSTDGENWSSSTAISPLSYTSLPFDVEVYAPRHCQLGLVCTSPQKLVLSYLASDNYLHTMFFDGTSWTDVVNNGRSDKGLDTAINYERGKMLQSIIGLDGQVYDRVYDFTTGVFSPFNGSGKYTDFRPSVTSTSAYTAGITSEFAQAIVDKNDSQNIQFRIYGLISGGVLGWTAFTKPGTSSHQSAEIFSIGSDIYLMKTGHSIADGSTDGNTYTKKFSNGSWSGWFSQTW